MHDVLSVQAPHIDKTDFLNAVMREKKRFENLLDDSVANGLNAGTEVLMHQVSHTFHLSLSEGLVSLTLSLFSLYCLG